MASELDVIAPADREPAAHAPLFVVADGVPPTVVQLLQQAAEGDRFRIASLDSSKDAGTLDAQLLVTKSFRVDAGALAAWRGIEGIQKIGVLTENIDLQLLRERGIRLRTLVPPSADSVADHTLALLLALLRKLHQARGLMEAESQIPSRRTSETAIAHNWASVEARSLRGLQLGLVGFGEIANQVARRAKAFGCRVSYTKRKRLSSETERRLGVRYQSLDELFAESDAVSLHLPHTAETEGLVDAPRLARMKSGAILINTARGGLVDEEALVSAVRSRHLAAVGLDVYCEEPLKPDSPLLELENAILTPHVAGAGPDALARLLRTVLRRWAAELAVRPPS
jgi:phosphoglycerate dehydrogenase-like enzyme